MSLLLFSADERSVYWIFFRTLFIKILNKFFVAPWRGFCTMDHFSRVFSNVYFYGFKTISSPENIINTEATRICDIFIVFDYAYVYKKHAKNSIFLCFVTYLHIELHSVLPRAMLSIFSDFLNSYIQIDAADVYK